MSGSINPCCGCMPLKMGTLAIAVFEAIYATVFLLAVAIPYFGSNALSMMKTLTRAGHFNVNVIKGALIILIVFLAYDLIISILLIIAAIKKKVTLCLCRIWNYLTIVASLGFIIFSILGIIYGTGRKISIALLIFLILRCYAIFVVSAFVQEIKASGRDNFANPEQHQNGHPSINNTPKSNHHDHGLPPTIPQTHGINLSGNPPKSTRNSNRVPTGII